MKKVVLLLHLLFTSLALYSQSTVIKAMVDSLVFMKADTLDCNADLYWRIVAKKQAAIPFLIEKLTDTTLTNARFKCKKTKLNVGEVAYFALKEIGDFPEFIVTKIQFDLIDTNNCWNFYEYFFDNANKPDYQQKIRKWYAANEDKFKEQKIPLKKLSNCQRQYKIQTFYKWTE